MSDTPKNPLTENDQRLWRYYTKGNVIHYQPDPTSEIAQPKSKRTRYFDAHNLKKIEIGDLRFDAKIDLHGLYLHDAYHHLLNHITALHTVHAHLILVVTGKSINKPRHSIEFSSSLREAVPKWLHTGPFLKYISDSHIAHEHLGGAGALYVFLKNGS